MIFPIGQLDPFTWWLRAPGGHILRGQARLCNHLSSFCLHHRCWCPTGQSKSLGPAQSQCGRGLNPEDMIHWGLPTYSLPHGVMCQIYLNFQDETGDFKIILPLWLARTHALWIMHLLFFAAENWPKPVWCTQLLGSIWYIVGDVPLSWK